MLPTHIGIILDGNRRFARELMKRPWEGHSLGLKKSREVLTWTCKRGIKYMTAYALSLENMKTRPKRELAFVLKLLGEEADTIMGNAGHAVHKFRVRVRFIGRVHMLPAWLKKKLSAVEERTKDYKNHCLNIAVAYGGQQEIVDAAREISRKCMSGALNPAMLDERMIKKHLYTNGQPFPDMIFRTGGEKRLSNFLPFQSVYSELIFTDKRYPDLTEQDFDAALHEFESRQRRFGK